ncbi:MAG TPA: hypothetical protein VGM01_05355 [Ktedonobacteraceae bacterium]|jgi:hypothetical protein
MSVTNLVLSFQNQDECWWEVVLADGVHEGVLSASSARSKSLLLLLEAVQILLQGASKAKCSWDAAYGEYRWYFSRQERQILIHILWFDEEMGRKTLLRMECDLLTFARELLHQVGQFLDPENEEKPVFLPKDTQGFQETIRAFEAESGTE